MAFILQPWQLLLVSLAGWGNQQQQQIIEFQRTEIDVLKEKLEDEGTEPVLLPPRSPNLNAHLERFNRSLKEECLNRMIFFGEASLRNAVREFLAHYHAERNHQGLDNRILEPPDEIGRETGAIQCRQRLGGMLRYYYRKAA